MKSIPLHAISSPRGFVRGRRANTVGDKMAVQGENTCHHAYCSTLYYANAVKPSLNIARRIPSLAPLPKVLAYLTSSQSAWLVRVAMRRPPSPAGSGDSHGSRSPPLKRAGGGEKVDDETNSQRLSYRSCILTQCATAAPPACTHLLSRSHDAPRASQATAGRGNHQPARQPSRLARAVGECSTGERSAVAPRPGSRP